MRVGERIAERRKVVGISQTRLARLAGVSQGTIGKLEAGLSSGSSHMHRIARHLHTTAAYLTGEIDDPDEGALPPSVTSPAVTQQVMMSVNLPAVPALEQMFLGLLDGIDPAATQAERALLLAQRLAIGLAQLHDAVPGHPLKPARRQAALNADADLAMHDREPTP